MVGKIGGIYSPVSLIIVQVQRGAGGRGLIKLSSPSPQFTSMLVQNKAQLRIQETHLRLQHLKSLNVPSLKSLKICCFIVRKV